MTDDLVKRLRDIAEATGPNEARQIALDAADFIEELEADLRKMTLDYLAAQGQASENFQMYVDANEARIDAEAKLSKSEALLEKAVEALDDLISTYVWVKEDEYERGWSEMSNAVHEATFVQMELKGYENE